MSDIHLTDEEFELLKEINRAIPGQLGYDLESEDFYSGEQYITDAKVKVEYEQRMETIDTNSEGWLEDYRDLRLEVRQIVLDQYSDFGELVHIENHGGSEGEGENVYTVLYLPKYDKYIRADAFYASYDGISEWQEWYFVKPIERLVTFYE